MNSFDPELQEVMIESEDRHMRSPEITFVNYRSRKDEELRTFLKPRRTLYLDMNFWISIRSPQESRNPSKSQEFLEVIRAGISQKRFVCPVSYSVLVELAKQKGNKALAQADLMDELSLGIGIRNPFDVARLEYLNFFAPHVPAAKNATIHSVFAPIGLLIGELYPDEKGLPEHMANRMLKVMFDVYSEIRLRHLVKNGIPDFLCTAAEKINQERKAYPRANKPFARLFAEELDGLLDGMKHEIECAVKQLALLSGDNVGPTPEALRATVNLLREVVTRELCKKAIPSQRIRAALHASIRMDDKRPIKANDIDDFGHASVAVAYCDAFFCDGPLGHLLLNPQVQNVIPHQCAVETNVEKAIKVLSSWL